MITIVSGTNRPNSNTLKVSRYYLKTLQQLGQEAQLFSLESLPENIITSDLYGKRSAEFEPIQELVVNTDKFMFIIPEYNGSFPGVLKTFIDACEFPASFYDKKAALTGISSGKYGNIRGIDHFSGVCGYLHLNVLPLRLHIPAIKYELNDEGDFFKEDTLKFTNDQISKLVRF
jgi:chromate reductase